MAGKALPGPAWQKAFLRAVRSGKSITKAAEAAKIAPATAYSRKRTNAAFAAAYEEAITASGATPKSAGFTRTQQWKRAFLQALAETSNVTASAAKVNIPTPTVYQTRRDNPKFAAEWRAALYEGYEHLEMEVLAYLRGTSGTSKLDTANAIRLLGAHRQTVAEIRAIKDDEDEQAVLDSIDALIDRMRSASGTTEGLLAQSAEDHTDD